MELPDLKHDFYNAIVEEAHLGPRRELKLTLELWQGNQKRGEGKQATVRFGGIANFEEVESFFKSFDISRSRWEGLHFLGYDLEHKSKPNSLFIRMQFDRTGNEVLIHCRHLSISH